MSNSIVQISNLKFFANLGHTKAERDKKQIVEISIQYSFQEDPQAVVTDALEDTVSYVNIIEAIKELLDQKAFNLVEHMSYLISKSVEIVLNQNGLKVKDLNVQIKKIISKNLLNIGQEEDIQVYCEYKK